MVQCPGLRRFRLALSAVLLVTLSAAPGIAVAAPSVADHGPATIASQGQASLDLAPTLSAGGRFVGRPGIAGSVDVGAWKLVSDLSAGEPPRFAPVTAAVATPTGPWSALGSNGAGNGALNAFVNVVVISGTNLYVGGGFTNAAGIAAADYVAKWNGSAWSSLGSNGFGEGALAAEVDAIAISGSNVFVGGKFVNAAGLAAADYIAKWSGSAWSALGSNGAGNGALPNYVLSLAIMGSDLYAGGRFENAANIPEADHVAKWSGSAWSALGSNGAGNGAILGSIADVYALAVSGTDLYVGGNLINVANIPEADYIAKWNGSAWSALGSNGSGNGALDAIVYAIAVSGTDLFVGGGFTDAAGILSADYVARWNGSAWAPLGSNGAGNGALNSQVYRLAVVGSAVYAGGWFQNAAGVPEADFIARWDGISWSALGSDGAGNGPLNNYFYCCSLGASTTDLYVGGNFTNVTGIATADYVARWSLIPFTDIADSPYKSDIIWVYQQGITSGCTATTYCPNDPVSRAQMATFLARALHLSGTAPDAFTDDNGSIYEPNINLVAQAGIASGCGGTLFCPNGLVSRAQMATFLARALHLSGPAPDAFTDDNGSIYEPNINLVAREGIATGCGGTLFCPNANVTRGQMAAFLHRAFGP
jgi:hypothetical protein